MGSLLNSWEKKLDYGFFPKTVYFLFNSIDYRFSTITNSEEATMLQSSNITVVRLL